MPGDLRHAAMWHDDVQHLLIYLFQLGAQAAHPGFGAKERGSVLRVVDDGSFWIHTSAMRSLSGAPPPHYIDIINAKTRWQAAMTQAASSRLGGLQRNKWK